ncbi:MAG: hypothetical protein QF570_01845, partial [Myxococcota bacterium]|nr:hypothetical protein [Myxococcota bacterium]
SRRNAGHAGGCGPHLSRGRVVMISAVDIVLLTALGFAGLRLWHGTGSPTSRALMVASLLWLAWVVV